MTITAFDPTFYRAANPDLAGFNNAQLVNHFQNFGLNEGRAFSPLVDLKTYRASNPDLAPLNQQQLFNHLQTLGVAEGRRFSSFVDLSFYRLVNFDLLGRSNEFLFTHLQTNGLDEDRLFSTDFSPDIYQGYNSDLSVFTTSRELLSHLTISGLDEGRDFSLLIDLDYYRANNPDLAGFSPRNALLHLEANGFNEGRLFSPFFNVNYYRANNADLQGTNRQLFEHFGYFGLAEGRPGRTDVAGSSFGSAASISVGSEFDVFIDYVGFNDSDDYYRFTLTEPSTFILVGGGVGIGSSIVSGELLNSSGQVLQSGIGTALIPFEVVEFLQAGTYYLHFTPIGGNTNYTFVVVAD